MDMAALVTRQSQTETGSVGGAANGAVFTIERARQLAESHEQPMLALKAYGSWMRGADVSARTRASALLDFTMYCNKFAVDEKFSAESDASLRASRIEDYFRLVLDEFDAVLRVHVNLPSRKAGVTGSPCLGSVAMPPKAVPPALLAALQVTLHNWASLELSEGDANVRFAQELFALSAQIGERVEGFAALGWTWEVVRHINNAASAVVRCDFAAAEEAMQRAMELVEQSRGEKDDSSAHTWREEGDGGIAGDTDLLRALCYYTVGVARENTACEVALQCYEDAVMHISQSQAAASYQAVMEQTREQLAHFVEEERRRERARVASEEAAPAANAERKAQGAARPKRAQGTAMRRGPRKTSNSRASLLGQSIAPVIAPPVPAALQKYLIEHGLSMLVCTVSHFKSVYDALARALPGFSTGEPHPASLFANTRFEADRATPVFAVLLCTSTPLQWTLRLRDAADQPSTAAHRSVWSPRPTLAPLLAELSAQRPPGPKSASASLTRKEIVDGNNKLRQQVLQLFAPPTAAAKVKQSAHESVEAVVQLLGQRLAILLKTERSFEDHWLATERVLSALRSYSVSQDLVRLKKRLVSQQRLRDMRRERSARTIAHFFRDIVGQRTRRLEQSTLDHQRVAERDRASVVLQKYVRRWLACQEARWRAEARADYVKMVVVVQSLARRRFARACFAEMKAARETELQARHADTRLAFAALQIQRVYRGHCARLRCYHLRGLPHQATLHHLRDSRDYYATLIQKRVRGMLVRRQYGKAVYAKRCYGRNVYRRQLWERSCITIQRAFRAARERRALALAFSSVGAGAIRSDATSSRRLPCAAGADAAADHEGVEEAAAQRIQDAYRTCVARRRLEALKFARTKETGAQENATWPGAAAPFSLKNCVF